MLVAIKLKSEKKSKQDIDLQSENNLEFLVAYQYIFTTSY
jgi:hypothetical protein